MDLSIDRIRGLNRQAERCQAEGRQIPWSLGVARDRLWIPESLTHLYHLPVYARMTAEQRLAYNQRFALLALEQSILGEEFLIEIIERVYGDRRIRATVPDDFLIAVRTFVREEVEHGAMFWQLLDASDPAYRGQRHFRQLRLPWSSRLADRLVRRFPRVAAFWVWMSLFFEERSLLIVREIKKSPQPIDALHAAVHHAHMVDEVRHVKIDEYFIAQLWDSTPTLTRRLGERCLRSYFAGAFAGLAAGWRLWRGLVADMPELAPLSGEVKAQLGSLGEVESYRALLSARSNIPKLSRALDRRPDSSAFSLALPCYAPPRFPPSCPGDP